VRVLQQEIGQYTQVSRVCCGTDRPCCLCNGYQPDHCLVVGWLALRLSACEFGSAVAGLHFVITGFQRGYKEGGCEMSPLLEANESL
jgi:hypothetical protein